MKQPASLVQRTLSLITGLALLALLAGVVLLGVIFIWYLLAFGVVAYLIRKAYFFFKTKPASFEAGHVHSGDFRRAPGRVIEHGEENL